MGGGHLSKTTDTIEYEKVNPKTQNVVKLKKRKCVFCVRNTSQLFTKQKTLARGQIFEQKGKCKHGPCSTLYNTAWCDLNNKADLLKLYDKCPINKCLCRNVVSFTPQYFQMERSGFKSILQNFFNENLQ